MDWLLGLLGPLLEGGASAYGYEELMSRLRTTQSDVNSALSGTTQEIRDTATFDPVTVRSAVGSTAFNPATGLMKYNLAQNQQDQMNQLGTGAMDMYARASADPTQRETDIYNRIRAMQEPGETRQYESMNANLFGSGRGGMSSSAYGGSPEQHAFAMAQGEARNQASYQAMNQAQQEMLNYANIGNNMMGNQYLPMQNLREDYAQGLSQQSLLNQQNMGLAGLLGQMGLGGATTAVNFANVEGSAFSKLVEALASMGGGVGDAIGDFLDTK